MKYNEYIQRAYRTACKHGFHDKELPMTHWLTLVITEVAEMVEADRKEKRALVAMFKRECATPQPNENKKKHWVFCFETFIKDSFEDEMADACIRLFDLAGLIGCDIERLPTELVGESYIGKYRTKPCTTKAYELCNLLAKSGTDKESICLTIQVSVSFLECWAMSEGIDLEWHIAQKMEYNGLRARLHGKKY